MYHYLTPSEFVPVRILFVVVFAAVLYLFGTRAKFLFDALKLGGPDAKPRTDDPGKRVGSVLTFVFGQKRVVMFLGGIGHFVIFWGFLMISLATLELLVNAVFPSVNFWRIPGFQVIGLIVDLLSLAVIVAIVISLYRRFVIKPKRLEGPISGKIDAVIILGLISTLIITYFMMGGMRITAGEMNPSWAPVSNLFSGIMPAAKEGNVSGGAKAVFGILWAIHLSALLFFMYYIPRSKHLHLLGAIPNIFLRDFGSTGVINKMDFEKLEAEGAEIFGVRDVEQYSWKQLLDTYACTECGRCQEQCPAYNTGKQLTPKGLVHEIKEHLFERAEAILAEGGKLKKEKLAELLEKHPILKKHLVHDGMSGDEENEKTRVFSDNFVWACTTCQACQTSCPVWIEHVQLIVDIRRYLTLTESRISPEVQLSLQNMEKNSNPWGIGGHKRGEWAKGLDIPTMAEKGEKGAEYLLYVGCSGSFDEENKVITIAVAKILKAAGIDFAILGEEEMCCGETARRLGNEYLSDAMMQGNVEVFKAYNVKKIITICPHGYNTLKNEYSQYGGNYEVYHHSEFIKKLIDDGKIKLKEKADFGNVVWHDSCYLGRYNNIYDQPRDLISKATGKAPTEMAKHGKLSFCCGAGGGGMWMEEHEGTRINMTRTKMAVDAGADAIASACPFCRTMFLEATKNLEKENIKCLDIAQIVLKAMGMDAKVEAKPAE